MTIKLNFLTEDDTKIQTCKDYWLQDDGDFVLTAREVATTHNVKYSGLAKQLTEWCQAYSLNDACEQCEERFWVYSSRSDYQKRQSPLRAWLCSECQEAERLAQIERERQRLNEVEKYFSIQPRGTIQYKEDGIGTPNSLEEIAAFLSLIRLNGTEDLTHIRPLLDTGENRLSPSREYDVELIQMLASEQILCPNVANSPVDAFVFEDGEFTGSYYLYRAAWNFPTDSETVMGSAEQAASDLIETLEENLQNMEWPERWNDEWIPLWKKIALEECLQYLQICLNDHGFDFSPGKKTKQVLTSALNTFSVAQVYNFIWGASRDAAAYYMRERIPKKQAANSAVGSIQRKAERAIAEGWDIKAYGRDRRCPRTMISQILFDTILHIGEEGFTRVPE